MKKFVVFALILSMALSLIGCGSTSETTDTPEEPADSAEESTGGGETFADGPTFNLVFCHGSSPDTPVDQWANQFKENIEEVSGGKITVDIYPSNQLGSERELTEGVQVGTYDIYGTSPISTLSFIPALEVLNVPYMFTGYDADTIDQALNHSTFTDMIEAEYEENNFILLGGFQQGATYRNITSSKKIETIDDFQGLKLRVTENPLMLQYWTDVGASPTAVTFNELYMSLQQGVVEAQENPFDITYLGNFFDVQEYLVISNHILHINHLFMNKDKFESMPEAYQEAVQQAATDARITVTEQMVEMIDTYHQQLIDEGLTEIVLSDDVISEMSDRAATVEQMVKDSVGEELYNTLVSALGEG